MTQHILIIGSGMRESVIIKKLLDDSSRHFNKNKKKRLKITCIGNNKNPFIVENCDMFLISNFDTKSFIDIIKNIDKVDFAIVGPEAPLELGFADILEYQNIPCIGPMKRYAEIETSKIKAREFIQKYGMEQYSPKYSILDSNNTKNEISEVIQKYNNIVIKKDGLCGGKGVKVQGIDFDDKKYLEKELVYLNRGEKLLIEDKLEGQEFSLMTITDGFGHIDHFPPIQDNKRLNNNDTGPNTGGMGCVIDVNNTLPFLNEQDISDAQNINKLIIDNLNKEGKKMNTLIGYRGILYGSYIKSPDGKIYIIEFNARFGDPECYIALELLKTNFYLLCNELIIGNLSTKMIFDKRAMIGVYMVPKKYPQATKDKFDIYIDDSIKNDIIYGQVDKYNDHLYSMSSRTLIYGMKGDSLYECYKNVYNNIKLIKGNLFYRTDIGAKFLSDYERSGVSINKGNDALQEIKQYIKNTYTEDVLGKFGDFGGQFKLGQYNLVSSIDGVGTKSILAAKIYGDKGFINLGKDIVNHSVNDILVQGAYPLFFLDYFGTSHLNLGEISNFIKGVSEACIENGHFPLIGGETAEMPSIYIENKTDLVGCIIGLKDDKFFKNTEIVEGDILIGIESVSPHTNGYSLINKIIDETQNPDNEILETLLKPHKSYLSEVNEFVDKYGYDSIKGMCHVTGGGMDENLKRIIPNKFKINYENDIIDLPEWCKYISEHGNIPIEEMKKVYNCGIGFILIIPSQTYSEIIVNSPSFNCLKIGKIK